jgi:DNA polymerase-1
VSGTTPLNPESRTLYKLTLLVEASLEATALGVPLEAKTLETTQEEVEKEKDALEQQLKELAPPHPEGLEWRWRNSNKDVSPDGPGRAGMHRLLGLVGVKLPNLEEQTLLDNREKHQLVKVLYEYKKVASLYSKYRRYLLDFYENGRLYPQPKIAGAKTGRVLYTDPNIQGFDKKKTNRYRACIRADEGYSIVKGDFAQQELRIAAYFSQDVALMSAFANGEDVYMKVAEKIAGKPVTRGTEEGENARAAAKRATLGYLYGLGPEKYRKNVYKDTGVELTLEDAERDRDAFRAAFPDFYAWQKQYGAHKDETNLKKKDMWETRSVKGWRRVVEGQYERKSSWKVENNIPADWLPKYTERLNGPIQSTAGDILYLTLMKLDAELDSYPGTRFLFTAHDEVVLTCPSDVEKEVAAWLKAKMVEAFEDVLGPELGGPKSVEVGFGPSWGECEEWEV